MRLLVYCSGRFPPTASEATVPRRLSILLAALIAVAIVGAISATGRSVDALYTSWSGAVLQVLPGAR